MVKKVKNINNGDIASYGYNENGLIARRVITSPHEGKKNRIQIDKIVITDTPTVIDVVKGGEITFINQSGVDVYYGGDDTVDNTYPKLTELTLQTSKNFRMYAVVATGTATLHLRYLIKG